MSLIATAKNIQLSIIIPVYNEETTIPELVVRLKNLLSTLQVMTECIFVNDGSTDNSATLLISTCVTDARFQYLSLSRNFGHQSAILAGLKYARGIEAVFIIDADLQDPPELLNEFYQKYLEGYDVVYGIRNKRKEPLIKRFFYSSFYRLLNKIAVLRFPVDSGDFSLVSIINQIPENNGFFRGARSWIGFKQIGITYERAARKAGRSKYSFTRLVRLAMNGIYNYSELPIRVISILGVLSILVALVYLALTLISRFVYNTVPAGFTALLFTIVLFSGVQLLSLGVIGEYVIRTFFEVKNRPLFIVENKIFDSTMENE
jgi:dolichol-phosphate mannosyltransferase